MCFWKVDRRIAYGGFAGDEQTYARQVDVIKKAKQLLIANPSWCKYVRIASQPSTGKSQRGNPNDQHQHGSIECVRAFSGKEGRAVGQMAFLSHNLELPISG